MPAAMLPILSSELAIITNYLSNILMYYLEPGAAAMLLRVRADS